MNTQPWIAEQLMRSRTEEIDRDTWARLGVTGGQSVSPRPTSDVARAGTRSVGRAMIRVGLRLAGPQGASDGATRPTTLASGGC